MEGKIDDEIRDKLTGKHACYILITCDPPCEDGKMNVAMTYEGDPVLASYLLQGAQSYLEETELEKDVTSN